VILEGGTEPVTITPTPKVRTLAIQVARALDNPDTWCRYAGARDAGGVYVVYDDPAAVRWCAIGHAVRLGGDDAARDLSWTYWSYFNSDIALDNDDLGREYVRDRLLELANRS
jgi:hypothetical protein